MLETVDLRSQFPDVINQGYTLGCVPIAISSMVQFEYMRQNGEIYQPSPMFIYYNSRLLEGTQDEHMGTAPYSAFTALNRFGVCREEWWPLDKKLVTVSPPIQCYSNLLVGGCKGVRIGLDEVEQCVRNEIPVFILFESTRSMGLVTAKDGIKHIQRSYHPVDTVIGLHAGVVVGFHRGRLLGQQGESNWFIVRNSRGIKWGDEGHFYYSFSDFAETVREAWYLDIHYRD